MAYVEHNRVVWSGTLGTNSPPPEEFSFGLNFVGAAITQGMADSLHSDMQDFFDNGAAKIHSSAVLRHCKLSVIGTDGHVVGDVINATEGEQAGGTGSPLHPFQCSLAISMRTGERGPSKRGRFYLPAPALTIRAQDGEIDATDRGGIIDAVSGLFTAMAGTIGVPLPFVVASKNGYNTTITGFSVGRVVDTIRARRRSLDEAYGDVTAL